MKNIKVEKYQFTILNIPNFWLNFYVHGMVNHPLLRVCVQLDPKYKKYNFSNKLVFRASNSSNSKLVILDTDDPSDDHFYLQEFDKAFLSQKLISKRDHYGAHVISLPPHFPFQTQALIKMMLKNFFKLPKFELMKEIVRNYKLKKLHEVYAENSKNTKLNYIFYYRTLWKMEHQTNSLGVWFMEYFKSKKYEVEGGLYRSDGYKSGVEDIDRYLVSRRLKKKNYIQKLHQSRYVFNSPAVRSSLSWRFAEYLFANKTIISNKIKVEVPFKFKYYEIPDSNFSEFSIAIDRILDKGMLDNSEMVKQHLLPEKQIDYIIQKLWE